MVADIATLTSFVVLVFMKLPTVPLFFDWLTRLKIRHGFSVAFFMPSVTALGMNPCMARLA